MREFSYRRQLKDTLRNLFPGCEILENDPSRQQGIPDLIILYNDRWAMLEVKRSGTAGKQPNQDYYVEHYGRMSFAAFIYPENEEEVLHALQLAFGGRRASRISQPKQLPLDQLQRSKARSSLSLS